MSLAHKDDSFETPDWIISDIKRITHLNLDFDLCATSHNKKCPDYYSTQDNALSEHSSFLIYNGDGTIKSLFCNPPRSLNGKFVTKVYENWRELNLDIIMMLCWNDLGNKYGEKLLPHILKREIMVRNLGKVKFCKQGIESEFPSRLTYFWAWFKSSKV